MNARRIFSWLLIAGGSCLLFLGAREWAASRFGQMEAEREFERTLPSPNRKRATPDNVAARPLPAPPPPGASIARLVIPRLSAELYVVEGLAARDLRRGPGHMEGTPLPGEKGSCVIAGHRDTHFRILQEVRHGDEIRVETGSGSYLYRVSEATVVSSNYTEALRDSSEATLKLVTCYPFHYVGNAPKRYIVNARLSAALPPAGSS